MGMEPLQLKALRALRWLLIVISVAAILITLAQAWTDDDQAGSALQVTSLVEGDPVVIQAFVSTDRAAPTDTVRWWFHFQNGSIYDDITDVTVSWQGAGFHAVASDAQRIDRIEKEQSHTFSLEKVVEPTDRPVRFNLTGEFVWTRNGSQYRRLVSIGPIVVSEPTDSKLRTLSRTYVGYLKDLAIPIVIVWLTIVGSRLLKESELKRTAQGLLLERVRETAESHYLALVGSARQAATRLDAARAKPLATLADLDVDLITYYLLRLFSTLQGLVNSRGGYILPDKEGEEIVAKAHALFTRLITSTVSDMESRVRATAHVTQTMNFADFKDDAVPRPAVRNFRHAVSNWITSGHPNIVVVAAALRIFASTLSYEINVAYFSWYEEWPELTIEQQDLAGLKYSIVPEGRTLATDFIRYRGKQRARRNRARVWA
jgi:hypothetical protein